MKRYLLLPSFFFASAYNDLLAESPSYILTKDGVIVFTDLVFTGVCNAVKREAVSDNIIRVTVAPGKEIMPAQNFQPVVFDGKRYYALTQTFQSTADDAWYGLGQHQDGILMRGRTKRFYIKGRE